MCETFGEVSVICPNFCIKLLVFYFILIFFFCFCEESRRVYLKRGDTGVLRFT